MGPFWRLCGTPRPSLSLLLSRPLSSALWAWRRVTPASASSCRCRCTFSFPLVSGRIPGSVSCLTQDELACSLTLITSAKTLIQVRSYSDAPRGYEFGATVFNLLSAGWDQIGGRNWDQFLEGRHLSLGMFGPKRAVLGRWSAREMSYLKVATEPEPTAKRGASRRPVPWAAGHFSGEALQASGCTLVSFLLCSLLTGCLHSPALCQARSSLVHWDTP